MIILSLINVGLVLLLEGQSAFSRLFWMSGSSPYFVHVPSLFLPVPQFPAIPKRNWENS